MSLLDGVLTRVRQTAAAGRLPVVVLDLDSTLIHTGPRHHRIVADFVAQHGSDRLRELAAALQPEDFGFLVEGPLRARGFDDEAEIGALRRFWRERFFTPEYLAFDGANPGAVPFVERLVDAGGLAYYLTARPADLAGATVDVLLRHRFPFLRGRTVLHLKPSRDLDDNRFKRAALAEVRSLAGEVCATFENEPAHAAAYLEAFPGATHFLVGDIHSPSAPEPHPSLVSLPSFRE